MPKVKKLLSLDAETCARLEQYAKDNHTNVSQRSISDRGMERESL